MPQSDCISVNEYPGGILAIDSGFMRDHMASCYLLESGSEVAFIETGTNASVSRLLQVLERRGWSKNAVRYVIVTHIHLDHAGGAGRLMQQLPEATFLVHPRGAPHMIDPSALEASVRGVYGDEIYDSTYGALVPIDASRIREMHDGDTVRLGERELLFADTPGHARHHFCIWDQQTGGWFSGDTFGLSYRELDTDRGPFIFPTTTPIQFDPDALKASIKRLLEMNPRCMYLTHYGRVADVSRLAEQLRDGVEVLVRIAERYRDSEQRSRNISRGIAQWLVKSTRQHGVTLKEDALHHVLQADIELNTQGLEVWLDRRQKPISA